MDYNVSIRGDQAKLQRMYNQTPRAMRQAAKVTINRVVRQVQNQAGGLIPRAAGSSVSGYRRVRSKRRLAKASRLINSLRGEVWQGTLRIPAKYAAGRLRQTKRGVRAGKLFFDGAFLATMASGYTGIFKRKGAARLPIEQEYIYLDDAPSIVARLALSSRGTLSEILEDEVRKTWNRTIR